MLPGFVDGYGHCFMVGFQAVSANLLPPPEFNVSDIAKVPVPALSELKIMVTIKEGRPIHKSN